MIFNVHGYCSKPIQDHNSNLSCFAIRMHLQFLSDEILVKIFSYFGPRELCRCTKVCKRWNYLTQDPILTFNKYFTDDESLQRIGPKFHWKDRFALKANWTSGHCKVQSLNTITEVTPNCRNISNPSQITAVRHLKISNCGIEYLSSVNHNATVVHVWNLLKKSYDHTVYCDDEVISLAFGSKRTANILAVGLRSGKFVLWDIERKLFVAVQDNRPEHFRTVTNNGERQNNFTNNGNAVTLISLSDDKLVAVSMNSSVRLWQIDVEKTGTCNCLRNLVTADRRCKVFDVQLKREECFCEQNMNTRDNSNEKHKGNGRRGSGGVRRKLECCRTFCKDVWTLAVSYIVEAADDWNLIGLQKFWFEGSRLLEDSCPCPARPSYDILRDKRNKKPYCSMKENFNPCQIMGSRHGISCLSISPCTQFVTSAQSDNTIHLWDTTTKKRTQTLFGHTGAVTCAQVDYHKVVSGSRDRKVKVWSLETGDCQLTLPENHSSGVTCVTFNDRWVVSGDDCGEIKVWDFTGRSQETLYCQDAAP